MQECRMRANPLLIVRCKEMQRLLVGMVWLLLVVVMLLRLLMMALESIKHLCLRMHGMRRELIRHRLMHLILRGELGIHIIRSHYLLLLRLLGLRRWAIAIGAMSTQSTPDSLQWFGEHSADGRTVVIL